MPAKPRSSSTVRYASCGPRSETASAANPRVA
jgi:hypothetical protein